MEGRVDVGGVSGSEVCSVFGDWWKVFEKIGCGWLSDEGNVRDDDGGWRGAARDEFGIWGALAEVAGGGLSRSIGED